MSEVKELTKGICAVVKKDFETLMRILGVKEVFVVNDWGEAKRILDEISMRKDVAIVLLQKSIVPQGTSFVDLNLQQLYPIVVLFPDTKEILSEPLQSFYRELIRRYIGYEIHLG
jgi:vacuolar-type H+-ATPase subunit F/Vma7